MADDDQAYIRWRADVELMHGLAAAYPRAAAAHLALAGRYWRLFHTGEGEPVAIDE